MRVTVSGVWLSMMLVGLLSHGVALHSHAPESSWQRPAHQRLQVA